MEPHSVIIQLSWETHQKKTDGSHYGAVTDKGQQLFVINADNSSLANEYIRTLINFIKEKTQNVSELTINRERLEQAQIQGVEGPRDNNSDMFSMRGRIGGNRAGQP